MSCAYIAFTETGLKLAERLAFSHPGSISRGGKNGVKLSEWTAENFQKSDALIFIGAVGIAVRAIAPHCKSKATDPAVIVLDERGRFSIPILSGHLGGANDLAKKLASICGAVPVITTATDIEGVFAVDEWAKAQNCHVSSLGVSKPSAAHCSPVKWFIMIRSGKSQALNLKMFSRQTRTIKPIFP